MEFEQWCLDAILVPLALSMMFCYHIYLCFMVRTHPSSTVLGTNSRGCKIWISLIVKENEKRNILAVQTLRNIIMGATLMASTSILLTAALAALITNTYSIKKPLNDTVFGANGNLSEMVKYITILTIFFFSFFCLSLSIHFINHVSILINIPLMNSSDSGFLNFDYVADLLEKGFLLNLIGNRLFYVGFNLILWIFGPVLVFVCGLVMLFVFYQLDFVSCNDKGEIVRVLYRNCEEININK